MSGTAISLPAFWKTFNPYANPPSLSLSPLQTITAQLTHLSQNIEHNSFAILNRAERGGNFIQTVKTNHHSGFPNARVKYLFVMKQVVLPQRWYSSTTLHEMTILKPAVRI